MVTKETSRPKPKASRATPKAPKKPAAVSTSSLNEPRRVKPPRRTVLKWRDKRFRPAVAPLPSSFKITKQAYTLLIAHWKLIGGMVLVYGVLTIILVHGLNGGTNVTSLKQDVNQIFHGSWGHLVGGLTVFGLLLTSSGTTASDVASAYQTFLIIVVSLAIVWTFRQLLADQTKKLRIRDGFYQGMYPLIPVILVLFVISLQMIPVLIGATLYGIVSQGGIATTGPEKLIWIILLLITICISLYLVCSSLFALYIVTLPNMTPLKALRSARGLVRYRRFSIIRKLLFLPLFLLLVAAVIMVPFILFVTPIAQWAFFALTMLAIAAVHGYMYILYRSLLE